MFVFSAAVRRHPCPDCPDLIDVPIEGGEVTCTCGSRHLAAPRDTTPLGARLTLDEPARRRRLDADPERPYLEDADARRVAGGDAFGSPEAVGIWGRVYAAAADAPEDRRTQAALVHFTFNFLNAMFSERGRPFMRAALEATLDRVHDHDARQDLRAMLARMAAREGDLASAEAWLEPCDPRPTGIVVESGLRLARATIELQRGRPEAALAEVGAARGEVPLGRRSWAQAALIRAHAFEVLGREADAIAALRADMARLDPGGQVLLAGATLAWSPMPVCPRSFPLASIEHLRDQLGDNPLMATYGRGFAVIGAGMLGAGAIGATAGALLGAWLPLAIAGMATLSGAVFYRTGAARRALEARTLRIRAHGIPARARLDSLRHLGPSSGSYAMCEVGATLFEDDRPPRPVTFELCRYYRASKPNRLVAPGAWIPVRIDPDDPSFLVPDAGSRT